MNARHSLHQWFIFVQRNASIPFVILPWRDESTFTPNNFDVSASQARHAAQEILRARLLRDGVIPRRAARRSFFQFSPTRNNIEAAKILNAAAMSN